MAPRKSPQVEDGYVRIANELYEAVWRAPFSHRQHKVIFTIIRKTYGYGKKEDDMSASQIGEFCRLGRAHVTNTLNQLAEMNVITKKPGTYGSIVGINKDYSKWVFPSTESVQVDSTKSVQVSRNGTSTKSVQGVPNRSSGSTESVQVDSTKSVHTKDNLPKDNQQKTLAPSGKISLGADGRWIGIPQALLATWSTAYPALSLDAELAKAAAWIIANPKNKKSNYARYLTNWLSRAQDSAKPAARAVQPGFDPLAYVNRNRTKPEVVHVVDL